MKTPWGNANHVQVLQSGILSVSTPGHGGLFVPDELLAKMPGVLAQSNGYSGAGSNWFEEDCEWALPVVAFPELFDARKCQAAVATIQGYAKSNPGEYFYSANQWLASKSGIPVKARAAIVKAQGE